jgi:AcrR family transcriptional regulator
MLVSMAPTSSLESDTPSTSRRLLDATVEAIDAGGEPAVKVQEIAARAGVAIPGLYRHFRSREGLVQAAQADRLHRDLREQLDLIAAAYESVDDATACREITIAALRRATGAARTDPRWRRINVLGSTYGRPDLAAEVAGIQGRSMRELRDLLRRPFEAGWLRPGLDLDATTVWLAGQLILRFLQDLSAQDPEGPLADDEAFDELWISTIVGVLFG